MKSVVIIAIAFVFLFVPIGAYADTITIKIASGSSTPGCATWNSCYIPSTAKVDVGGVVIMSNTDTAAHTYTSGTPDDGPDGVFDTSL